MPQQNLSSIVSILKTKGFRLTLARKQIIAIFEQTKSPISVDDLNLELHAKSIHVNKSTLYREVEFLVEQKVIKPVQFQEKNKRYELADLAHHHHLICNHCGNIEEFEVENCLLELKTTVSRDHGFTVEDHTLDFYGQCSNCQKNKLTKLAN
jgi:Fur family transcriptional regulator, ferric uptake regulator